jgi:hypothetical protein
MQLLLLLILLSKVLSKTGNYYTDCVYGSPQSGLIAYSECQEYAVEDSHCCLLYFVTKEKPSYNFFSKKVVDAPKKEIFGRKLESRWNFCFGLTKDGYNNIKDVIKELKNESGLDDININCFSKNLKLSAIIILLILF